MTSKPGDVGRRLEWVEGPAVDVVLKTIELVHTVPGAHSFEFGYDAVDRELAEGEEPDPTEPVRWWVKAYVRAKLVRGHKPIDRTWVRYAVYDPASVDPLAPSSHAHAIVLASVALLEAMGANVVLLDDLRNPPTTQE